MAKQKQKIKVGDVVALTWDDTVAYGRTTVSDDRLVLAEFVSYGIVSHFDERKIVIRQEVEVTPREELPGEEGEHRSIREPVVIPTGCVTKVMVFRPSSEGRL